MKTTLTAMTFNIGNGLAPIDRLRAYLDASASDIVALQEVDARQAEAIEQELADAYPFRVVQPGHFVGRGILSRFPITASEWIAADPARPDLRATIEVNGAVLTIVNAHPSPPRPSSAGWVFDAASQRQIRLAAQAALDAKPALLLGDFNMTSRHSAYAWMRESGLIDVWASQGRSAGRTLPVRMGQTRRLQRGLAWVPLKPVARVDYIWHTDELETESAWLGDDIGSDHLPVLATIATRES